MYAEEASKQAGFFGFVIINFLLFLKNVVQIKFAQRSFEKRRKKNMCAGNCIV